VFEGIENYAGNKVITTGGKSSLLFEGGRQKHKEHFAVIVSSVCKKNLRLCAA